MTKGRAVLRHDRLHKSVRRPPDAALYWFMRHARRGTSQIHGAPLIRMASGDIGSAVHVVLVPGADAAEVYERLAHPRVNWHVAEH
jgi:replication-associated recombination protein RarA